MGFRCEMITKTLIICDMGVCVSFIDLITCTDGVNIFYTVTQSSSYHINLTFIQMMISYWLLV